MRPISDWESRVINELVGVTHSEWSEAVDGIEEFCTETWRTHPITYREAFIESVREILGHRCFFFLAQAQLRRPQQPMNPNLLGTLIYDQTGSFPKPRLARLLSNLHMAGLLLGMEERTFKTNAPRRIELSAAGMEFYRGYLRRFAYFVARTPGLLSSPSAVIQGDEQ